MSDQPTRIRLCRELEVEIGGRRIEHRIRGSQGRMLLAYLVLHRDRPVRRSELEDALWEETRPAAPDALAPPLSRLRSALGADRLTGRTQLRLELGDGAWIDVEAAERAVADARAAVSRDDPEAARAAAEEAIAIASGGLMSDLEADWLVAHRTRVDDLHVDALEVAATAAARQGGDRLADASGSRVPRSSARRSASRHASCCSMCSAPRATSPRGRWPSRTRAGSCATSWAPCRDRRCWRPTTACSPSTGATATRPPAGPGARRGRSR